MEYHVDDAARRRWVEGELSRRGFRRFSGYGRALDAITRAAMEHLKADETRSETLTPEEFEYALEDAASIVDGLSDSIKHKDAGTESDQQVLWSHRTYPIAEIKAKEAPQFGRAEIEETTAQYLRLPYRSEYIDRTLVDLLVALEIYAFGEEMINPKPFVGSPLKVRPIVDWFLGNLFMVVFWIVIAAGFHGLNRIGLFPDDWLVWPHVVLGLLFAVNLVWSTLWLPRRWWSVHKLKKSIRATIEQMLGVYSELRSDGPISARHIEERARTAANAGVVWPPPLFVLLEDISRRDGMF